MAEMGVLHPDARLELLDGQIHDMSPIGLFHTGVVNHLIAIFAEVNNTRWVLQAQSPLRMDVYWEPEPDLMLLKPAPDFYKTHRATVDDVLLLIEVADSSLETDRNEKLPAYARFRIPEVWIVNLVDRTIEIYREPELSSYGLKTVLRYGGKASPAAFPDVTVDVAELLQT